MRSKPLAAGIRTAITREGWIATPLSPGRRNEILTSTNPYARSVSNLSGIGGARRFCGSLLRSVGYRTRKPTPSIPIPEIGFVSRCKPNSRRLPLFTWRDVSRSPLDVLYGSSV